MSTSGLASSSAIPTDEAGTARHPAPAFVPRRWLSNGHVMTIYAWACRRRFPALGEPEACLFEVSADTQVLAHVHWQPERRERPTVVLLHGLEGSSTVHYMRGLAEKAWRLGWNVVRLNQRNCGGTEHLTPGLYHSGLTSDPLAVIRTLVAREGLRDIGVIGYSLGGNLTLKLAAEATGAADLPIRAVAAVCPTIDLERCVRAIERRRNLAYHYNFVRNLRARMRRKDGAWPGAFDLSPLDRIRTIRRFDDVYTAPHHGFGDATTYYRRASAIAVAERIGIPALIVAAEDDPFVPADQFRDPRVAGNPQIDVRLSKHGGHCAFVAAAEGDDDGFWAEREAIRFLARFMPARDRAGRAGS